MDFKIVIETDSHFENISNILINNFKRLNCKVEEIKYIPFSLKDSYNNLFTGEYMFPLGSINMMRSLQRCEKKENLIDFCGWPLFSFTNCFMSYSQTTKNEKHFFNYPFMVREYSFLENENSIIFGEYKDNGHIFIRPDSSDKCFAGKIFDLNSRDYKEALQKATDWSCEDVEYIIISKPKYIMQECRFIIYNKNVITSSIYKNNGKNVSYPEEQTPQEAVEKARYFSNYYSPYPLFVLDLACDENNVWKILEIGSIHVCGLYNCNLKKVCESISDYMKNLKGKGVTFN